MALCSGFTKCHNFSPIQSTKGSSDRRVVRASAGTAYRDAPAAVDYGRILGVGPNASKSEVKAAYRKLALRFHPDVCRGVECEVSFMEVNRAYESLMALPSSGNQSQPDYGFASYRGESATCDGFEAAEPAAGAQEDDPWAEFLQSLVNGTHEGLREDFSSYYSNLKCYSKAGRNRRYTGSSQYYQGNW